MNAGIALLNFGEPATPTREAVVSYLERIFFGNAALEEFDSKAAARDRARTLAERRAPDLIEEYEKIGGSPLAEQAFAQAGAVEEELDTRGHDVTTYVGMQFAEPLIAEMVEEAVADGVERIIVVPVYPLSGPSTNLSAVANLKTALENTAPDVSLSAVTGWHRHPTYTRLRVQNIREYLVEKDLNISDSTTHLVFSAHGTPIKYLEAGSRYDRYVEEYCETIAALLDIDEYTLGFQNHDTRNVAWTEPEIRDAIASIDAERIVVEPISFLHEQSETLFELDIELASTARDLGLEFYRIPVPHDDPRLSSVIGDVVEPFVAEFEPEYFQLRQCQCRESPETYCLNAPCK